MKKNEILEGNKLIAEFMGGVLNVEGGSYHFDYCPNQAIKTVGWLAGDEDLFYNAKWDWLMPALKKMRDYLQTMERPSKNHCCKGDMLEVDVTCALLEINIEKTYKNFIPLVQWYNSQRSEAQPHE